HSAWPMVELTTERFAGHLADRLPESGDVEATLRRTYTSDLYLACACLQGDEQAIAAFDLHCMTIVDRALSRLGLDSDAVSEVKQRLRSTLLLSDNGPPKLLAFGGRGDLRHWIRVLAVNEARAMARRTWRHVRTADDRLVDLVAA